MRDKHYEDAPECPEKPQGYIPAGGLWTAAEREAIRMEGGGDVIRLLNRADSTVAALVRALGELANADDSCACSPDSEGCDWCERRINARALLAEVK